MTKPQFKLIWKFLTSRVHTQNLGVGNQVSNLKNGKGKKVMTLTLLKNQLVAMNFLLENAWISEKKELEAWRKQVTNFGVGKMIE